MRMCTPQFPFRAGIGTMNRNGVVRFHSPAHFLVRFEERLPIPYLTER